MNLEQRIEKLLSGMSLEEKVLQLTMKDLGALEYDETGDISEESLNKVFEGKSCGVLQCPFANTSHEDIARRISAAQNYLKHKTSSGIPAIPVTEGLHGLLVENSTVFPQAISLGSSWNPQLIEKMGQVIAAESTACGIKQLLSPVFDVIRDARWGRVEECYSEDSYLTTELSSAFVVGAQGDPMQTRDKIDADHVACTAKHFVGYSQPQRGINLGPITMGERELRSTFFEPFTKAVKESNIYSVMPSYSEIDGIPVHANPYLLRNVLRDEWGFDGYIISDYLGITMLKDFQHTASSNAEAARQSLLAGVDLEAPTFDAYKHIPELVKTGLLDESIIDESVRNILRVKLRCGLMDEDFVGLKPGVIRKPEHIELSRELSEDSIILLKNKANILPLDKNTLKKIAVIGPNADRVQFGDYSWTNNKEYGVTIFDALKNEFSESEVSLAAGCDIWRKSNVDIQQAAELAANSDIVVLALGGTSMPLGGVGWEVDDADNAPLCGEGYDRSELAPPGCQMELFNAVYSTGKPVVVIFMHGRPWAITKIAKKADAILEAWYPGEQGGQAIANILSGKVNPSGRLPVSIPHSVGQMPLFYNQKPSGNGYYQVPGSPDKPGRDYVFESPSALYPFEFGLSYTSFEYGTMEISKSSIPAKGTVKVTTTVRNTGTVAGKETVQLYVNDVTSSVTTPEKVLRGFKKIALVPGETVEVSFELGFKDFALWNSQMQQVVESGEFEIMIGRSSEDIINKSTIKI
jgi:beta-glucosidase